LGTKGHVYLYFVAFVWQFWLRSSENRRNCRYSCRTQLQHTQHSFCVRWVG